MKSKDQQLLEEAYTKINEQEEQDFSYYSGPSEDIMFLADLDVDNLKRKVEQEGKQFKTAYVASQEDVANYRHFDDPDMLKSEWYIFYDKQDFAHPALIPV